ncbi:MAG: C4-type zinc ribbon domain-containing protein [Planctomycetota bacterium]
MKEIIDQLKKINDLDVRLSMVKKDLERLPRELAEKQIQPRNLKATIERNKAEITRLKMETDALELEVKSGEETLKRYAGQLNITRNNKEFDAVRRQMDAQRAWNKENESKYYKLVEDTEAKQKDLDKNSTVLVEAEKELAAETVRVNQELAELRAQYDTLAAEREVMTKEVPDKELSIYNRIVNTHGLAISKVGPGGICSACFMKIPPQFHNLALLAKDLVCCPSCGRILTAG